MFLAFCENIIPDLWRPVVGNQPLTELSPSVCSHLRRPCWFDVPVFNLGFRYVSDWCQVCFADGGQAFLHTKGLEVISKDFAYKQACFLSSFCFKIFPIWRMLCPMESRRCSVLQTSNVIHLETARTVLTGPTDSHGSNRSGVLGRV